MSYKGEIIDVEGKDPAVGKDSPRTSSQVKGNKCQKFQVTFFKPATRPRVRGLWCVCVLFLCQENVTLLCQTFLFKLTVQRKLNLKSAGFFIFIFKAP